MVLERVSISELLEKDNLKVVRSMLSQLNPEDNEIILITNDENDAFSKIVVKMNSNVNMYAVLDFNILNKYSDEYLWFYVVVTDNFENFNYDNKGDNKEVLRSKHVRFNGTMQDLMDKLQCEVDSVYKEFLD